VTSPDEMPAESAADATAQALALRYGRTPQSRWSRTLGVAITAGALVVAAIGWFVWSGPLSTPAELEVRDTGHVILSERETEVRWQITLTPGTPAKCAVQALDSAFGIVGWLVVDLPASPERTRDFSQVVRTTEQAVTGLIYRCWLT
jgi:hypothetical protein